MIDTQTARLYEARFDTEERERKAAVWRVLCEDFFQRYVRPTDTVLDLGAGYCEFINHIRCARRIAVDTNPDTGAHAAPGVEVVAAPSTALGPIGTASVDVAFVSNFFEHLPTKTDFLRTLEELRRALVPGGRLLVLQPNVRLMPGTYWDFLDHHLPLSDRTIAEALALTGFQPIEIRPRFLPYTTKSRLPQAPWLVRLYLRLPPAQWLLGKQAWIVAVKAATP